MCDMWQTVLSFMKLFRKKNKYYMRFFNKSNENLKCLLSTDALIRKTNHNLSHLMWQGYCTPIIYRLSSFFSHANDDNFFFQWPYLLWKHFYVTGVARKFIFSLSFHRCGNYRCSGCGKSSLKLTKFIKKKQIMQKNCFFSGMGLEQIRIFFNYKKLEIVR